jgi:hypothetical protein
LHLESPLDERSENTGDIYVMKKERICEIVRVRITRVFRVLAKYIKMSLVHILAMTVYDPDHGIRIG